MSKVDRVVVIGHVVAILPVISYLALWFSFSHAVYDKSLNLIGPPWLLSPAGQAIGDAPLLLSFTGGIVCVIAGIVIRKWVTVGEGLWACAAAFVLLVSAMM